MGNIPPKTPIKEPCENLASASSVPVLPPTLIATVMETVHEKIASRALIPGSRLPSIRKAVNVFGVSKSTVVEAYERLQAAGVIQSKPGAGYFVAAQLAPLALSKVGPRVDREIDPLWISRQSLDASIDVLKPGCGWLPSDWMPEAEIRRAIRKVAKSSESVLSDYATASGLTTLRELLSRRLAKTGISASVPQILLTESGTQAIDLLCRCLLQPGDTVLVDDPCYFNFHALLKAHRAHVVTVPYTETGPDIELLENVLNAQKPRLYITNSGVHNPTGASLSADTAHRVLNLAEQHNITIIEDDIFADFEDLPAVRLAALDGLNRVCHIGSFSKTLSASVRSGFIAAPENLIEELLDLKIATSFGSSQMAAEITLAVLSDSGYRKHLENLRRRLSELRIGVEQKLASQNIQVWTQPRAGLYLWCRLPDRANAAAVAREAFLHDVVLAPGNAFSLTKNFSDFMRINVAQSQDERVYDVLEQSILTVTEQGVKTMS